ncbi:hypothetical protein [Aeoliella sp. SH292]|uniref:hypothetical protein n=1 Tax=Aeoliella sp. SH292 TaxID=3454464 RepID=UPI003F9CAF42
MLITALVVGGYVYLRLDDEVRRYAEGVLASHYSELDVKLGSARFEAGRGVMLRNLTLSERSKDGRLVTVAEVDEMQLLGPFDIEALTAGKPLIERVCIRSPRVHAEQRPDGSWNFAQLFPPPSTGDRPAAVEVTGALLTVRNSLDPDGKPLTLRDVNLAAECIASREALDPLAPPVRTYQLEGSVGGELADVFKFAGTVQTGEPAYDMTLELKGLDLASPLVASLVHRASQLDRIAEVRGDVDTTLKVAQPYGGKLAWQADYKLTGCRVALAGVPRPLTNLTAHGHATGERLFVERAEANYGKAVLSLALNRHGWHATAPLALRARAENLVIDDGLAELLPPAAMGAWNRFHPAGLVTADVATQFDGTHWKPAVTLTCHDVSFVDREKFDYRLTGGTGTLVIADKGDGRGPVFEINNMTAFADGTPITMRGSFAGLPGLGERRTLGGAPLPAVGWLEMTGEKLRIADDVVRAIEPETQKVRHIVESLGAKGHVSVRWRFERFDPFSKPHTETDLVFHDSRVEFQNFRYPLEHVEGTATERDGNWRFDNLISTESGTNRVVRAAGTCTKTDVGHQLVLTLVGDQVPLDDKLRLALPPVHQSVWAAVRPQSGRVNFIAHIGHHLCVDHQPSVHLQITPQPQTVSIEPACFPYRLDNLTGKIEVVGPKVTLTDLRAEHGQTLFETDGVWVPNLQGGWQLQFDGLHVDRLVANWDLRNAVPDSVKKVIDSLKPEGSFNLHNGQVRFSQETQGSSQVHSEWNLSLVCQQNNFELGVPLKSVSGVVHLTGLHDGSLRFAAGKLDLDSVFWNGVQFTSVRGPLWVDRHQCRLGRGAIKGMADNKISYGQGEPERVFANLYGGQLQLDAAVDLDTPSKYVLDLAIDQCDLARVGTDYFGGAVALTGTLSGQATLNGMGRSVDLLEGGGKMAIRNAQMYELPVMARMLKVLRNRVPDKTAFNGVDAQFTLDGSKIHFNELNLLGDAVSLYGEGDATLDRQLDLKFYSTVGRINSDLPILKSMIGQASANLMLIKVTGPAENAQVAREPLPAVNEFMEHLSAEGAVATPKTGRGFWSR